MRKFVVVKVSYDHHRFENYLGIVDESVVVFVSDYPKLTVNDSKALYNEQLATEALGEDIIHYMVEEITND